MTEVRVIRLERPLHPGRCLAVAGVRVEPLGLEIEGIMVLTREDGSAFARLPGMKNAAGRGVQIIRLPADMDAAVKAAVLDAAHWTDL